MQRAPSDWTLNMALQQCKRVRIHCLPTTNHGWILDPLISKIEARRLLKDLIKKNIGEEVLYLRDFESEVFFAHPEYDIKINYDEDGTLHLWPA